MKVTLIVVAALISLAVFYFYILGQNSRSGSAPGLVRGLLSPCPDKPNCVCSDHRRDDAHFIEPLKVTDANVDAAMQKMQQIIVAQGGTIISQSPAYVAASFSSSLFGFVDDLEIRADADEGVIHLRSASRVGTSDLGANRQRVERIRQSYRGD